MSRSFHPYPIVGATKTFLIALILAAVLVVARDYLGDYLLPAMVILWGFGIFFIMLSFVAARFHTLVLDESSLTYHTGVLSTKNVVLPYSRITEASYSQGLVQRIFGVGTLNLDTAGGESIAIHAHDIKYSDIKAVIGEVKTKGGKGQGGL